MKAIRFQTFHNRCELNFDRIILSMFSYHKRKKFLQKSQDPKNGKKRIDILQYTEWKLKSIESMHSIMTRSCSKEIKQKILFCFL